MNEINYVEMFASYDTALAEMLSVEQAISKNIEKARKWAATVPELFMYILYLDNCQLS